MTTEQSVFDLGDHQDPSPADPLESTFDFLNRVDSVPFERVRTLIDNWWNQMCADSQADIRERLRSGRQQHFWAAFWELYIHESLRRLGCDVTCHPRVPGTSRQPDFLARHDGDEFYVEAKAVMASDSDSAAGRRFGQIRKALNRVESPNFMLWLDVRKESNRSPSVAKVRRELQQWLASLDPDEVSQSIDGAYDQYGALPEHIWSDQAWEIEFRAMPKKPEARGRSDEVVGAWEHGDDGIINTVGSLRGAIEEKAKAYGTLEKPFIIALLSDSIFVAEHHVTSALFGVEQAIFRRLPNGETEVTPTRERNGAWLSPNGPRNTGVSGVLVGRLLTPWNVGRSSEASVTLWHHPAAEHPIDLSGPPWRTKRVNPESGQIELSEPDVDAAAFFGLPDEWPGPEPMFPEEHGTDNINDS